MWGDKSSAPKKDKVWHTDGKLVPAGEIGNRKEGWAEQVVHKSNVGGASSSSGAYGGSWETSAKSWGDRSSTHASSGSGKWNDWSITYREPSATDKGKEWPTANREPSATGTGGVCMWADFTLDGDVENIPDETDDTHRDWIEEGVSERP